MRPGAGRRAGLISRVVASLLVLCLVLAGVDLRSLWTAVVATSPLGIAHAVAWMLASIAGAGVVWWAVFPACERRMPLLDAVRHTLVGASLNSLLPTSGIAGDVYRAWACYRAGTPTAPSAASVVLARWCSLMSLSASMWVVWTIFPASSTDAMARLCLALATGVSLITLCATVLLIAPAFLPIPAFQTRRILDVSVVDLSRQIMTFAHAPFHVCGALLLSFAALSMEGLALYSAADAIGAGAESIRFVLLAPAVRLVHQIPGFFNAVGVQEVTLLQGGAYLGVRPDVTIAISLLMHAVRVGVALLGLPLYWTSGFLQTACSSVSIAAEPGEEQPAPAEARPPT